MTSDEDRREVARMLRELPGDSTYPDLIGVIADHDGWYPAADAADRLADLIEPEPERTCRDVGDGGKFVCSKCGASFDYEGRWDEPTFWVDDVAAAVEYCPNCGARVVYE